MPTLQVLTSISQMVLETGQNINSKPIKMLIENFLSSISRDKIILSPRLLSVTENEVKIWSFFSGLILLIMNLSNSRYVYSNLNLHFLHAFLWRCTIHFKNLVMKHIPGFLVLFFFAPRLWSFLFLDRLFIAIAFCTSFTDLTFLLHRPSNLSCVF